MSVIVKGMEMPKEGTVIAIYKLNGKFYASLHGTELCPIVPLPEKHGRLIDAKGLEKMRFTDGINGEDCKLYVPFVEIAEAILKCPTIVEAEGD